MKIYVTYPYTAKTPEQEKENVIKSIDIAIKIWQKGHTPFIPLLLHYFNKRVKELNLSISYDEYMKWDLEWLNECDALLYTIKSKGTDIELNEAIEKRKIVYWSVDEIEDRGV